MFKDNQILGVILAVGLLVFIILMAVRMTRNLIADDKINFLGVLIVSAIVGVWLIDNVIAFKTTLLDPDENKFVIQTMAAVLFYVLGKQRDKSENKEK